MTAPLTHSHADARARRAAYTALRLHGHGKWDAARAVGITNQDLVNRYERWHRA